MYGEGYDFPPLFAYCLKDLVGAISVGMDCMSGDDPNWSATNTATYKEIWVEPVNRFMGALSIYLSSPQAGGSPQQANQDGTQVSLKTGLTTAVSKEVLIHVTGNRNLDLIVKSFNLKPSSGEQEVKLNDSNNRELDLEMNIIDSGKPYVLVLADVNNQNKWWELTGALVSPTF
jgi:hypothetical protein